MSFTTQLGAQVPRYLQRQPQPHTLGPRAWRLSMSMPFCQAFRHVDVHLVTDVRGRRYSMRFSCAASSAAAPTRHHYL